MTSVVIVAVLVALDRLFKLLAQTYLVNSGIVTVIPGILGLELLKGGNTGMAFGVLSGHTGLLSLLSLTVSVFILFLLVKRKFNVAYSKFALVLICAGAIGNLYDRMFIGTVTDYLVFLFMEFPTFNFADALVDTGAVILFYAMVFKWHEEPFFSRIGSEDTDENG